MTFLICGQNVDAAVGHQIGAATSLALSAMMGMRFAKTKKVRRIVFVCQDLDWILGQHVLMILDVLIMKYSLTIHAAGNACRTSDGHWTPGPLLPLSEDSGMVLENMLIMLKSICSCKMASTQSGLCGREMSQWRTCVAV